jgi:hypothetical protein
MRWRSLVTKGKVVNFVCYVVSTQLELRCLSCHLEQYDTNDRLNNDPKI